MRHDTQQSRLRRLAAKPFPTNVLRSSGAPCFNARWRLLLPSRSQNRDTQLALMSRFGYGDINAMVSANEDRSELTLGRPMLAAEDLR